MDIKKAEKLALQLMDEFGLLPEWWFKFDNAKRRFGRCGYSRGKKWIQLSRPLTRLNGREQVEDTIRHEIAHALDIEDRGRSNHSWRWVKWARRVGAKPERCYSASEVKTPEAPYYLHCPACERFYPRHRKANTSRLYSCSCSGSRANSIDRVLIANVSRGQKADIETGSIRWQELPQAQKLAKYLEQRGIKSLYLKRIRQEA